MTYKAGSLWSIPIKHWKNPYILHIFHHSFEETKFMLGEPQGWDVMWCSVMWRNAVPRIVLWCTVVWCIVLWCIAIWCVVCHVLLRYELVMSCDAMFRQKSAKHPRQQAPPSDGRHHWQGPLRGHGDKANTWIACHFAFYKTLMIEHGVLRVRHVSFEYSAAIRYPSRSRMQTVWDAAWCPSCRLKWYRPCLCLLCCLVYLLASMHEVWNNKEQ